MNQGPDENSAILPTWRQQIDDALYVTLIAALDCFRSRTLDNLDTAVSDVEKSYFEELLVEIDLAGAKLNSEGPGTEQAATGKYREARDA